MPALCMAVKGACRENGVRDEGGNGCTVSMGENGVQGEWVSYTVRFDKPPTNLFVMWVRVVSSPEKDSSLFESVPHTISNPPYTRQKSTAPIIRQTPTPNLQETPHTEKCI
jgi:hypothetical protein